MITCTAAITTLRSRAAEAQGLPWMVTGLVIICFSFISVITIIRVLHDSGVYEHLSKVCSSMDKTFHVHFSSNEVKLTSKVERWLRAKWNQGMRRCDRVISITFKALRTTWKGAGWAATKPNPDFSISEKPSGLFFLHSLHVAIVITVLLITSTILTLASMQLPEQHSKNISGAATPVSSSNMAR